MNNVVDIQVMTEKIIFKIPRANIVEEIDNMAFFDTKSEEVIKKDMEQGIQVGQSIRFKDGKPFQLFFDSQFFDLEVAALSLWNWFKFRIPEIIGNNIFGFPRPEVSILFDGYEGVSLECQKEFEYLIFRYLGTSKLNINGKDKRNDKRNDFPVQILIFFNFSFAMISISFALIPLIYWAPRLEPILPFWLLFILVIVGLSGLAFGFAYLGYLTSILLWCLCLKPFFSSDILFRALKYQYNMPIRRKIDRPTKFLLQSLLSDGNL